MTALKPMAVHHDDGIVPAWNFAMKYTGKDGHIATLPEIVEARLNAKPGDYVWERWFTTNSAEYYGVGADGSEKLIVAHGVGPMSTLEGIKKAYSWEYKDKKRRKTGGRISADDFLKLEAGEFGEVEVVDFDDYVKVWDDAFYGYRDALEGIDDTLLMARLGPNAHDYLAMSEMQASKWHEERSVGLPANGHPVILQNKGASNCPYDAFPEVDGRLEWSRRIPRPLEPGMAIGHLLVIGKSIHTHANDSRGHWQAFLHGVDCHEWNNYVRFVGVPADANWQEGVAEMPQPDEVLQQQWQRFMRPNDDEQYVPPRLFRIEESEGGEWFTRYPKLADGERMDDKDVEFHVRSVRELGEPREFKIDDDFFVRYNLSQVVALAPEGANAYDLVDISPKDASGFTTITVQFYEADVDTSQRLPRPKEIKQDYELLMG